MATKHPTSVTPTIRATEILDPYPERQPTTNGVRQPNRLRPAPTQNPHQHQPGAAHNAFTAPFAPTRTNRRRSATPIAATTLTIFGQAALGALIAAQTIEPTIGALAMVAWLTTGLALIVAQCLTIASKPKPEANRF